MEEYQNKLREFFSWLYQNPSAADTESRYKGCLIYPVFEILSSLSNNRTDGWVERGELKQLLIEKTANLGFLPDIWRTPFNLRLDHLLAHRFDNNDKIAEILGTFIQTQVDPNTTVKTHYRIKLDDNKADPNLCRTSLANFLNTNPEPISSDQQIGLINARLNYLKNRDGTSTDGTTVTGGTTPPKVKMKKDLNQILYGPPGTGKTYKTINLALEILGSSLSNEDGTKKNREDIKSEFDKKIDEGSISFTTFHQSMSYEDFIEGLKPIKPKNDGDPPIYRVEPGIFFSICEKATKAPNKNFVLIIDEINRGNVSAIFGELITLIEESKRIDEPEALKVTLPYSKEVFGVPNNVFIIGTMNTADRSVEALDAALRRRFSFVEMPPNSDEISKIYNNNWDAFDGVNLKTLLDTINERIEKLLNKDHQIGHSYFLKLDRFDDLRMEFKNKVIPLLQEYFYGDIGKINLVLGNAFISEDDNSQTFVKNHFYDSTGLEDRRIYKFKDILALDSDDFKSIYE